MPSQAFYPASNLSERKPESTLWFPAQAAAAYHKGNPTTTMNKSPGIPACVVGTGLKLTKKKKEETKHQIHKG